MDTYLGHLAALATSFAWSASSILFTLSGREVGSPVVNRVRLLAALLLVACAHTLIRGQVIPLDAELFRWGWLTLSGVIGFTIGDSFLFQAYVLIGPRLTMLMMALAPVFSAVFGWGLLGERLTLQETMGIVVTVGGVALVVTDRRGAASDSSGGTRRRTLYGLMCGVGAALGQAGGLVASKLGLAGDFPALSGNLIRLMAAATSIWLITLVTGQVRTSIETLKAHPRALLAIGGGAVAGPFIGVWLSLVAVQHAPLGIAATLMALPPVILLPVGRLLFKEHIGIRAIAGTLIAVTGTALLFLQP